MITDKAPISVPKEYLDFAYIFSKKSNAVLPKNTKINTHAINLKEGKEPSYGLIYSLRSIELKTLKTYIETNLTNGFICFFESPANASILLTKNSMKNFCFVSIIRASTISTSRTNTHFRLLVNLLIA